MSLSLHHFIHTHDVDKEKHERIHRKKYVRFLDKLILFVAFLWPIATAPQVYQIFHTHSAESISILTWSFYILGQIFWISYGIAHENKPIVISNFFWIFWEALVIMGAIIY